MGYQIPEQPLLIYPSLAEKFGLEEALLLGIYHQLSQRMGLRLRSGTEIKLDTQSWRQLVPFWSQDQIAMVTNSLVSQGAIDASVSKTLVKIVLLQEQGQSTLDVSEPTVVAEPEIEMVSRLQVVDQPPLSIDEPPPLGMAQPPQQPVPPPAQEPQWQQSPAQRTPAPAFGGSTGWRRHKSELQVIFEQHEERNQHLHTMFLGWQPTANFFELLPRHGISEEFARSCIDEFVLYWVNRDRRESNWDQKFLAWVKRDWVQKQTRDAREQRVAQQEKSFNNENSRRDTREKRKRVTQAIMDIKDTDW